MLYRDAEYTRRKDQNYLQAYLQYENIKSEFPKTVYSEAATCYGIKCLLALADEENAKKAKASIKMLEDNFGKERKRLDKLKKSGVPKAAIREMEKKLGRMEERIGQMKSVATGQDAVTISEKFAKEFHKTNSFGLYRGEVFLSLADYYLEVALDSAKAQKRYESALEWFSKIVEADATIEAFTVPDKAKEVSAPPPEERQTDKWTNVVMQKPDIGDIFNRKTCKWYMGSMRKIAALNLGLVYYVNDDQAEAEKCWKTLSEIDPFFSKQEQKGWGSVVVRLMWNIKYNEGCLYATPKEMKAFKSPRLKLAVYLSDLAYENEEHKKAESKYAAILSEKYGELNTDQKAYISYALANCYAYQWKEKECNALLAKFDKEFRDTPSTPRALLMRGNRATRRLDPGSDSEKAGFCDYNRLIKEYPTTKEASSALYYIGWQLLEGGNPDEASKVFNRYLKKYPDGAWAKAAQYKIAFIERLKNSQRRSNENETNL